MTESTERKPKKRRPAEQAFSDWIIEGHRVAQLYRKDGEAATATAMTEALMGLEKVPETLANPTLATGE